MRLFLKIIGGLLALILIIGVALNLYFTDDRLRETVQPYLNDAVGQPVQVESMSATFFSTFPRPGIEVNQIVVPGKADSDTVLAIDNLTASIEVFPLFSNEIKIAEISARQPIVNYTVFADSTTNMDFLFQQEEDSVQTSEGYSVSIPYFELSEGRLNYRDRTSATSVRAQNINGNLSLSYDDLIGNSMDLEVGRLSASVDSTQYLSKLPVRLEQTSTLDTDQEILSIDEGTLSIRGLALGLNGSIANWSETPKVDLQLQSSSDNFGDLLRLAPPQYAEQIQNFQARGSFTINGSVKGTVTEEQLPNFDMAIKVNNGYLKNPDLPQAIENIQLSANATNKLVTIDTLNANAGDNSVVGSGTLKNPLEETGTFNMDFIANVDLSTVQNFYDISQLKLQKMAGRLDLDANVQGSMDQLEKTQFNGEAVLADGMLKYQEVPKEINNINLDISGTQELLTIQRLSLQAAKNSLSAQGNIRNLLNDESRRIDDMNTNVRFDLSTIKEFYPIDEDTLQMKGKLTVQATLDGKADQIERAVQSGSINLKNGFIDYKKLDAPFRDITFESVLEGRRMTIVKGLVKTGNNSLQASGVINNYLSENRSVNLQTEGEVALKELQNYYTLAPDIQQINGDTDFNLSVKGPLNKPSELALSGKMTVKNGQMSGQALREEVKSLNGSFSLTPAKATLNNLTFNMGSSDVEVKGSLSNYMEYLKDEKKRNTTPKLNGKYSSNYLNLDELIDWSDTTSTEFNLELPDLNSNITANIDRIKITGVTMRNLSAEATSTPKQINLTQAKVELFEGTANGTMVWKIPGTRPSDFNFKGSLSGLRVESFFKAFPVLGEDSQFHKFISGTFNTDLNYSTKIDDQLNPLIRFTNLDGSFGMNGARVNNHPLQKKLASFTKVEALRDVSLDDWKSSISVEDNVLTLSDLSLTSDDIGLELNGTQHLISNRIDFHASLLLPQRFKKTIASVITGQAADALTQDNGTIMIPLRITGTYNNASIKPDQSIIKPMIRKYLKNKAGNTLKKLFGRDDDEAKPDSAGTDTTSNVPVNSPR